MLRRLLTLTLAFAFPAISAASDQDLVAQYVGQLKPLFKKRCYSCHGALEQEGGLRLDTVALMHESQIIDISMPTESPILRRVSTDDLSVRMPPEHEGEPFNADEVNLLRNWLAAGAPAPPDEAPEADPDEHWAFQPIVRPPLPASESAASPTPNPIDAFLALKYREQGLVPTPSADRVVLLRRLYLDLIGVPPTLAEIEQFRSDHSADAYDKVVDRLLADPRHGQRWARHWMDIWRYSDWWGLGDQLRNSNRHMWRWRDWIVDSLNADTGYDEMVRCMLAADELYPADPDKLVATGYLVRNYNLFNRNQWMDETVEHVSKSLLGLTMNCAKCHAHKYDPIEQVDFYKLRAFFEPYQVRLDMVPGQVNLHQDGLPRVYDGLIDAPTYRFIRGNEAQVDSTKVIEPGIPDALAFTPLDVHSVELPAVAWQPARNPWVATNYLDAAKAELQSAQHQLAASEAQASPAGDANPVADTIVSADLEVARRNVELAEAKLDSLQTRLTAMQAEWHLEDVRAQLASDVESAESTAAQTAVASTTLAAIRAEQRAALAAARREQSTLLRQLIDCAEDKRQSLQDGLAKAEEAVTKAQQSLDVDVASDATYNKLQGAEWSATRFKFSGSDDPQVPFPRTSTGRRAALARWITDSRNPLTARVAINHLWTRHFGKPLVDSVFDFGRNGATPVNQPLLDWLASELIENQWSMRHIHRLIVTSHAYAMSSSLAGQEANVAIDPDNKYLWRREPLRLESQIVRDSILALAGELDCSLGGATVPINAQANSLRRSLYFQHSHNDRNLFLTTFDEALVTDCYRREVSVVPQQALAMSNSQLVLNASPKIASHLASATVEEHTFISSAFLVILGIEAEDRELALAREAIANWTTLAQGNAQLAHERFIWTLLNHNDFVTVR